MGQSTADAMRIGAVLASVLGILWYASAFPAVQDIVHDTRIIHGSVDMLRVGTSVLQTFQSAFLFC